MSELLIQLLDYFKDIEIEFVLKKSNLKPDFFGTLQVQFSNNWFVSVVDDNGEFSIMINFDEDSFYSNYEKSDVKEVADSIIQVMNY